jgi:hypothetical protein
MIPDQYYKIAKPVRAFGCFGLVLLAVSSIGLLFPDRYYGYFGGFIIIAIPFVWACWIGLLAYCNYINNRKGMILLWVIINSLILILYLNMALAVKNWEHTQGLELVLFLPYIPMLMVGWGISYVLPSIIKAIGSNQMCDYLRQSDVELIVYYWVALSVMAGLQSVIIWQLFETIVTKYRKYNAKTA